MRPQVPQFNGPANAAETQEIGDSEAGNLPCDPQQEFDQNDDVDNEGNEGNFSLRKLGAKIVSVVENAARGFISEVYKNEIGGIDNEMVSDENLEEIVEEEAEEEELNDFDAEQRS